MHSKCFVAYDGSDAFLVCQKTHQVSETAEQRKALLVAKQL